MSAVRRSRERRQGRRAAHWIPCRNWPPPRATTCSPEAREVCALGEGSQGPVHPAWHACTALSAGRVNEGRAWRVVGELGTSPARLDLRRHRSSFLGSGLAGGLGAGIGTALGAKLRRTPARSDRLRRRRLVHVRQSSATPLRVSRAGKPPDIDRRRQQPSMAGRDACRHLLSIRSGAAAKANVMPVQDLNPSPDFEESRRVLRRLWREGRGAGDDLTPALTRAPSTRCALEPSAPAERQHADRPLNRINRGGRGPAAPISTSDGPYAAVILDRLDGLSHLGQSSLPPQSGCNL